MASTALLLLGSTSFVAVPFPFLVFVTSLFRRMTAFTFTFGISVSAPASTATALAALAAMMAAVMVTLAVATIWRQRGRT